jgi:hypothetical protein
MLKRTLIACSCLILAHVSSAAEIGIGATRDEVIAQLGAPKSKINAGKREVLGYANGRVTLVEGKVTGVDWNPNGPASPPAAPPTVSRPAPAPKKSGLAARSAARAEVWTTDFAAAQAEAAASGRRLLVLFTGSDWCPSCIQFEANVAHAPAFLNVATGSFVLVKLDYPRGLPQSAELRAQNDKLARQYAVEAFPSLFVISADGKKSSRVDTRRPRQATDMVDYFTQAVDEAGRAKEKSSLWPW